MPWTVRLEGGPDDGTVVGATKLGDLDLPNESAHIGWTAYDPRVWGTAVNPEAKLLLLGLAFDHGFGRVKLQADARNDRSRAAILKLGAQFEGIARRHKPRADGSWRDSAVYSVTVDDWPVGARRPEARLAARQASPCGSTSAREVDRAVDDRGDAPEVGDHDHRGAGGRWLIRVPSTSPSTRPTSSAAIETGQTPGSHLGRRPPRRGELAEERARGR